MRRFAFSDMIEEIESFSAARSRGVPPDVQRGVVMEAYDEVAKAWDWRFLKRSRHIFGYAAEDTGTVDYDHTGGTNEREVTITGGTFPTWVTKFYGAALYIDGAVHDIDARISSTVVTLHANLNPGADLSEEDFVLFQRWLPLPDDFGTTEGPMDEGYYVLGTQTTLEDLAQRHRWVNDTGDIRLWAIGANPNGGLAIHIYPALNEDKLIDLVYRRRMRELRFSGHLAGDYAGTVSVTGTTVTGTGTSFVAAMAGSLLRLSSTSTLPTGIRGAIAGSNPYLEEHLIASVDAEADPQTLALETSASTLEDVGYRVTDPIDLERAAWDMLRAGAKMRLGSLYKYDDRQQLKADYRQAFIQARIADNTGRQPAIAGAAQRVPRRLADQYTP